MPGFPLGAIVLIAVAALIFLGLAHRTLDRLYLTDRAALLVVAAMVIGSYINIPLVPGAQSVSLNVGGGLIPIGLAVYVLVRAGTGKEVLRALAAAAATAAVVFLLNSVMGRTDPFETRTDFIDPLFYYPLAAGIVAYIFGRSRRGAFIGAVFGVLALDLIDLTRIVRAGVRGTVAIGGAGAFDVMVMAAVFAVLLAEIIGETRERIQGGVAETGRPPSLLRALKAPKLGEPARKPERGGDEE